MIEIFYIYKWAFVLVFLASAFLAVQGSHFVARRESLQILALSQAALLGNIVSHLVIGDEFGEILSLLVSFVMLVVLKIIFIKNKGSNETMYIVAYLFLMAIGYLLITAFPALDSHLAVGLFGDIVSLSEVKVFTLIVLFIIFISHQFLDYKNQIKHTIEKSVLGRNSLVLREEIFFAISLVLSLFGLGLLFTVCFTIFPVVLLGDRFMNYRSSLIGMGVISGGSAVAGLSLSLFNERLSTIPSQVVILLVFLIIVKIFKKSEL